MTPSEWFSKQEPKKKHTHLLASTRIHLSIHLSLAMNLNILCFIVYQAPEIQKLHTTQHFW